MSRLRKRRRKRVSPILAACLLCGAAAAALSGLTRVPVREVKIHGAFERVAKEDIQALVAPHLGWGWLRLPVERLRGQLESLRWVASARVRREWPLSLSIEIAERRAVARWDGDAMLDEAAAIFDPGDSTDRTLPMLRGPEGSQEEVLARYRDFSRLLDERRSLAINMLSLDARGSWTLELQGGLQLRLGAESVGHRFARALLALEKLPQETVRKMVYVDLRYPNGFAVAWQRASAYQPNRGRSSP